MATNKLDTALKTLIQHAPALRAAGYRVVKAHGVEAELLPLDPQPIVVDSTLQNTRDDYDNPLDDPDTYGTGRAPGFERPDSDDD